jgi:hypothetical protein
MTITPERMKVLYFSQPYYTTPAAIFVTKTTRHCQTGRSFREESGRMQWTYGTYLDGSLVIPGEKIDFLIKAQFKGYDTDHRLCRIWRWVMAFDWMPSDGADRPGVHRQRPADQGVRRANLL